MHNIVTNKCSDYLLQEPGKTWYTAIPLNLSVSQSVSQSYLGQIQSYLGQIQSYLGQFQSYLGQN